MRITKGQDNVFIDCGFPPAEAENLRLRADMMIALRSHIKDAGLTKPKAAALMGVTQAQIADLMKVRMESFSADTLIEMLASAGLRLELTIKRPKKSRKAA